MIDPTEPTSILDAAKEAAKAILDFACEQYEKAWKPSDSRDTAHFPAGVFTFGKQTDENGRLLVELVPEHLSHLFVSPKTKHMTHAAMRKRIADGLIEGYIFCSESSMLKTQDPAFAPPPGGLHSNPNSVDAVVVTITMRDGSRSFCQEMKDGKRSGDHFFAEAKAGSFTALGPITSDSGSLQ